MKNIKKNSIDLLKLSIIWFIFTYAIPIGLNRLNLHFLLVDISGENSRAYIIGIWQVQAAVSLVAFTVISLVLTRLDTKYYGFTLREYCSLSSSILSIFNIFLDSINLKNSIITAIMLIGLNYFNFLFDNFNSTVFIFSLNVLLIIKITNSTMTMLFYPEKYKKIIKNNYIERAENGSKYEADDMKFSVVTLVKHLDKLVSNNQMITYSEEVPLLCDLYKISISKKNSFDKQQDSEETEIIMSLSDTLIIKQQFGYLISLVKNLLVIESGQLNKISDELYFVLRKLFQKSGQSEDVRFFIENNLYNSIILSIDEIQSDFPEFFKESLFCYSWYVYAVLNHSKLSDQEKFQCIYKVIRHNSTFIDRYDKFTVKKREIILIILKEIIHNDSNLKSRLIKTIIKELSVDNRLGRISSKYSIHDEIIVQIACYLYYGIYEEQFIPPIKKELEKIMYEPIDIDNCRSIHLMNSIVRNLGSNIWMYYETIVEEMQSNGWEYIPLNTVKTIVMPDAINKFFIYTSEIYSNRYTRLSDVIKTLNRRSIMNLLFYYKDGTLNSYYESEVNRFSDNLEVKSMDIHKKSNLYKELIDRLKEIEVNNTFLAHAKSATIEETRARLIEIYRNDFNNFPFNDAINDKAVSYQLCEEIDIDFLAGNESISGIDGMMREILGSLIDDILKASYKIGHKVNLNLDKNPKDKLLNYLKQFDSKLDLILGSKLSNCWEVSYEMDEKERNILERFEKDIEVIDLNVVAPIVLTDKSTFKCNVVLEKLEIRELTNEELLEKIKESEKEGIIQEVVSNGIKINLTINEAKEYLKMKSNYLFVEFKVEVYYPENTIVLAWFNDDDNDEIKDFI